MMKNNLLSTNDYVFNTDIEKLEDIISNNNIASEYFKYLNNFLEEFEVIMMYNVYTKRDFQDLCRIFNNKLINDKKDINLNIALNYFCLLNGFDEEIFNAIKSDAKKDILSNISNILDTKTKNILKRELVNYVNKYIIQLDVLIPKKEEKNQFKNLVEESLNKLFKLSQIKNAVTAELKNWLLVYFENDFETDLKNKEYINCKSPADFLNVVKDMINKRAMFIKYNEKTRKYENKKNVFNKDFSISSPGNIDIIYYSETKNSLIAIDVTFDSSGYIDKQGENYNNFSIIKHSREFRNEIIKNVKAYLQQEELKKNGTVKINLQKFKVKYYFKHEGINLAQKTRNIFNTYPPIANDNSKKYNFFNNLILNVNYKRSLITHFTMDFKVETFLEIDKDVDIFLYIHNKKVDNLHLDLTGYINLFKEFYNESIIDFDSFKLYFDENKTNELYENNEFFRQIINYMKRSDEDGLEEAKKNYHNRLYHFFYSLHNSSRAITQHLTQLYKVIENDPDLLEMFYNHSQIKIKTEFDFFDTPFSLITSQYKQQARYIRTDTAKKELEIEKSKLEVEVEKFKIYDAFSNNLLQNKKYAEAMDFSNLQTSAEKDAFIMKYESTNQKNNKEKRKR